MSINKDMIINTEDVGDLSGIAIDDRDNESNMTYLDKLKLEASEMNNEVDKAIINEEKGTSLGLKANGDTSLASDAIAQYTINKTERSSTEITLQSNTITNRKNILTDEILLNDHKLNPQLHELSDMRVMLNNLSKAIGNLNMDGTVLIKTWEPQLGKWVLIRRKARVPIFYQELDLPKAHDNMSVDQEIDVDMGIKDDLAKEITTGVFQSDKADSTIEVAEGDEPIDETELIVRTQIVIPKNNVTIDQSILDKAAGSSITINASTGEMSGGISSSISADDVQAIEITDPGVTTYSLKEGNKQLSKDFTLFDLKSKDNADKVLLSGELITRLQALRDRIGKPIIVTSCYRSPAHNKKVGGARNSQHMKGTACDIKVSGMSPKAVRDEAKQVGFNGLGVYRSFTHVDVRTSPAEWRG